MRVALVLTTGEGGIPHYTAELANSLSKNHDVFVIKPTDTTADKLFSENISIFNWFRNTGVSWSKIQNMSVDYAEVLKSSWSYRNTRCICELNPDIVHFTHQPHTYLRPFISVSNIEVPVIQTNHDIFFSHNWLQLPGRDFFENKQLFSIMTLTRTVDNILRKTIPLREPDGFIVHTSQNQAELKQYRPEIPVDVIPHGAFSVFKRAETTVKSETDSILFFGSITQRKDINQLVKSVIRVSKDIPNITATIAGSGRLEESVRQQIHDNSELFNLYDEYIPNDEVSDLFAKTQVVIIPHKSQGGHSGTMTIAYSHGKPIIATNVGDYDEMVRGAGAGFIVEPSDHEAMANAIKALLHHDNLRDSMGQNSASMAETLSWDNIAEETVSYYNEIISLNDRG